MATVIYLHGFASSPNGTKGLWFRELFEKRGVQYRAPDLNVPSFEKLTVTAMIERVAQEVEDCPPGPIYLIGSSMGGFVTTHYLNRHRPPRITKVVLLAPVSQKIWPEDEITRLWRETGHTPIFHHAYNEERPLHYQFAEDVERYQSDQVQIELPVLILHGKHDDVVDHRGSVTFAENRANVELRLLESGHTLVNQLDEMAAAMLEFFNV